MTRTPEQFVIRGGTPLQGEIKASGNKNAALPLLPACLLTDQPVILNNMPDIGDVHVMCGLLQSLGAEVEWLAPDKVQVHAANITTYHADPELAKRIRPSTLLAGAMLARVGQLVIPPPGGDVIGRRRLDTHIMALEKLGANISFDGVFKMQAERLQGADILLDEASVTATENTILAAALAKGTTIIRNAASEPHVQQLCHFLNQLGAQIEGIGSNRLIIEGVERLAGGEFRVGADYLEVGSYIGAAVVTGGELLIRQADPQYLSMIQQIFQRLGVTWETRGEDVFVPRKQALSIKMDFGGNLPEIKPQVWPGFPTDMMSIAILIATQSSGAALFHEWMFEGRLFFTDRLSSMGANIILCDPHRVLVQGPTALHGDQVITSPDIRAGMAMVLAALAASGETIIRNIVQIDRGYTRLDERLRQLGADIQREPIGSS
ncbi:MAG: UDP-N-acetylglucosamine 1-carboxyvinyltransferase [Chloroflexi bacterium]|nr:UDP-N-acetylglucosamine 1-carboxyvinyltransferase [Chloroflexota bacterium]